MKSIFYLLMSRGRKASNGRSFLMIPVLLFLYLCNYAQSPGGVSTGLRLWVKADAGTVVAGGKVTAWNDQSPGLRHLTTTSTTYQPQAVAAGAEYNFNPYVNFNGHFLRYTGNVLPANSGASIFSVASQTGGTGYNTLWDFYANDPTINTQGGRWLLWHSGAAYHNTPLLKGKPTLAASHWLHNVTVSSMMDINGLQQAVNKQVNTNGNNYFLGAGNTGSGEAWVGGIAENIVYDAPLAAGDQAKVNSYLAIKYGITLDADPASTATNYNYVSSAGTTIWDGVANSNYHHDITGLGRDDASALLQLKSKSINDGSIVTLEIASPSTDGAFLVVGDNAGNAGLTTPYSPNSFTPAIPYFHFGRIWKVQGTGVTGSCTITVSSSAATYLLVHNSDDFSSGTPTEVALVSGEADIVLTDGQYFTFAGPANAPGGVIQDLACWLKADAGTSTTTPGANVSDWLDQSGNGNTHSQATAGAQPTYVGAGGSFLMNYQPALRFDGSNDKMSAPAYINTQLPDNNAVHVFVVSRINANSSTAWQTTYGVIDSWVNALWYNRTPGNYLAGNQIADTKTGVFYGITSHIMPKTVGTTKVIWNGTVKTFSNLNYNNTGTTYSVGADVNNADYVGGDIQEVIVYKGAPNLDFDVNNLAKIQTYLAIKYGISLDPAGQADYLLPNGTLIWTGADHPGYQYHIFGLGRDDNSGLYQKQAFSYGDSSITVYLGSLAGLNSGNNAGISSNNSFLVLGDNNVNGYTVVNYPSGTSFQNGATTGPVNALTNRIWKADATTQNTWTVNINTNKFRYASYVLVSADPAFPDAGTRIYPVSNSIAENVVINDGEYFRFAAYVKAPGGIVNNLSLWMKADAGLAATGTADIWMDQSIFGKDMQQSNATYRPTITAGSAVSNFNPVLTFNGHSLYRDQDLIQNTTGAGASIFSAGRPTTITGTRTLWDLFSNTPTLNIIGSNWNYWNLGGTHTVLPVVGEMQIANGHWVLGTAGSILKEVNGNGQTTAGSPVTPAVNQYLIGAGNTTNSEPWLGDIAENIVYNVKVSPAELVRINTYLAIKYGVTLKNTSTYQYEATDGSLVWDGAGSGGFHNNVAGIGRDEMEDLDQKQSRSVNPGDQITVGLGTIAADNFSNTSSFNQDIAYLVWGDNGIANANTTLVSDYGVGVNINHLNRVWRVENNGVDQVVRISIPNTLQPGALVGSCEQYKLITSSSGTISGAAITSIQPVTIDGSNYVVDYTFPAGVSYFTLARVDPASSGVVVLPTENTQADNFADCSTTEWIYFYADAAKAQKLTAMSDFTTAYLNNLTVDITPAGYGYASASRESSLMPRITTVTDATAGTFPAAKIRIYYSQEEMDNSLIPGAITNTWLKYSGDANAVIADLQNDGIFEAPFITALTPDASGIEDGVNYVEFHNITSFSSFIHVSTTEPLNVLLPVKLGIFKGTSTEAGILLNWTTVQELNNKGFAVERSVDGTNWQQLAFIPTVAKDGNSNTVLNYQFTDGTPANGINHYRLKQVDIDNRSDLSKIISVRYAGGNKLSVTPNPLSHGFTVVSGLNIGDELRVFNQSGVQVYRQRAAAWQHRIDLRKQPAGVYYLEIVNGNDKELLKIIKQ